MSTPEIMMLLTVLPKALQQHPEWFTPEHLAAAQRLLREMQRSTSTP